MKTYEAWVMMDENGVVTEEYNSAEEEVNELKKHYTVEEMHRAGIECCKLLCSEESWLECLEIVEY